jgi:hypothetical protein
MWQIGGSLQLRNTYHVETVPVQVEHVLGLAPTCHTNGMYALSLVLGLHVDHTILALISFSPSYEGSYSGLDRRMLHFTHGREILSLATREEHRSKVF